MDVCHFVATMPLLLVLATVLPLFPFSISIASLSSSMTYTAFLSFTLKTLHFTSTSLMFSLLF
jgi:hypothetical protein